MAEQHSLTQDYQTPYKFNGKELDRETGYYYYGARYYNPRISIWLSKAFMAFAKSEEGKAFLDNYASKGQKLEYNGEVYYQAGEAGKYDKAGIDLNYSRGSSKKTSYTRGEYIMRKRSGEQNKFDVNIEIAKEGFGSNNKTFNLLKAIIHESFIHGDPEADDFMDNGKSDESNLPKQFRRMQGHGDHYKISRDAINNPDGKYVKRWTKDGFNILNKMSKKWNLNFTSPQIKAQMWDFSGSLINVNPKTGKLKSKG